MKKIDSMKEEFQQINEENLKQINERIENVNEAISQKIDECNEERKQEIAETNEKLERTKETIVQVRIDLDTKIGQVEESSHAQMQSIRTDFGDKCLDIDTAISEVRGQGQCNQERIEGLQRTVDNRPTSISNIQPMDNQEAISFKTYRRNPMEFLERVNEQLIRNGEDRWPVIRSLSLIHILIFYFVI